MQPLRVNYPDRLWGRLYESCLRVRGKPHLAQHRYPLGLFRHLRPAGLHRLKSYHPRDFRLGSKDLQERG